MSTSPDGGPHDPRPPHGPRLRCHRSLHRGLLLRPLPLHRTIIGALAVNGVGLFALILGFVSIIYLPWERLFK